MKNKGKTINLLSLVYYGDEAVFQKTEAAYTGSLGRQLDYAERLDEYIIICRSKHEVKDLQVIEVRPNFRVYYFWASNPFQLFWGLLKFGGQIIKKENINCIITDNPFLSGLAGTILKMKFKVFFILGSMAQMIDNPCYLRERRTNYLKNILAKFNFYFADLLRVSTEAEIADLEKKSYPRECLVNSPFYIDFSPFTGQREDDSLRKNILGTRFDRIVLSVGRLAKQKDYPTLLAAISLVLKQCPRTKFLIIGTGPESEKLSSLLGNLGLQENVEFLGSVPYQDIPRYYKASDMFVLSSIYEGTCMVLLEAGISFLPIAATSFAGALDLIENGKNGFVVPVGDSTALATAIINLLNDEVKCRKMGELNYVIVKDRFSRGKALEKFEKMIEKITV